MLIKQWWEVDKKGKTVFCTGYFLFWFIPLLVKKELI